MAENSPLDPKGLWSSHPATQYLGIFRHFTPEKWPIVAENSRLAPPFRQGCRVEVFQRSQSTGSTGPRYLRPTHSIRRSVGSNSDPNYPEKFRAPVTPVHILSGLSGLSVKQFGPDLLSGICRVPSLARRTDPTIGPGAARGSPSSADLSRFRIAISRISKSADCSLSPERTASARTQT